MEDKLVLCDENYHYTGVEVISDEENPFYGGVSFVQSFPHMMLGHTTEQCVIRREDIQKVIEFLQKQVDDK